MKRKGVSKVFASSEMRSNQTKNNLKVMHLGLFILWIEVFLNQTDLALNQQKRFWKKELLWDFESTFSSW